MADDYETDPITNQVIWPEEILIKARASVVAYQYAGGLDEEVTAGKFDHWHAVQVACYAIAGRKPPAPMAKRPEPKPKMLDFAGRVRLVEAEMKVRTQVQTDRLRKQAEFIQRTLNARQQRKMKT